MSETREAPPNDYRDPFWRDLIARTEERVGIPRGLLQSVILFGERSNNDQTNSNNTRTIFQIIPSTRDAFLRKYGVDAYLSPENAAEVAALHLKESLDRNNNSIASAVGEYHGSPNRSTWGPRTNAYIARVLTGYRNLTNPEPDNQTPAQRVRYENVRAAFEEANLTDAPVMRTFEAYRAGRMTPEDASTFEQEVRAGNIMLPRGAGLIGENIGPTETRSPLASGSTAIQAPQGLLDAYTQNRMTHPDRLTFEKLVADGQMAVPQGFQMGQTPRIGQPTRAMTQAQRDLIKAMPTQRPSAAPAGAPVPPAQAPQPAPQALQEPFAANDVESMAPGFGASFAMPSGAAPAPQAPQPPQAQLVAPPVAGPRRTETTLAGMAGAATRGMAPAAAGALFGGALAAPTGVGVPFGAAMGATAATLAPIVGDPAVALINRQFGTNFTQPSEALNDLFRRAGIMEPATATERVVQSAAGGASMGGAQASAFRELAARALARDSNSLAARIYRALATGPRAQVGGAAGAGGGSQTAAEMDYGELGQAGGALLGGLGGAGAASARFGSPPRIAADVAAAERAGVPLMTSDVAPPRTFIGNWLRKAGEVIPVAGTGGARAAQQQARVAAVQNILREHGATDTADAIAAVSASVLAKRAEQLTKYSDQKAAVINGASSTRDVPVPNVTRAIDAELAGREMQTNAFAPVRRALEKWREDLQGQNLQSIEQLRKALGQVFEAPELASIRTAGEQILSRLYAPLRDDMGQFIRQESGEAAFNKWQIANRRLSEMAGELKNDSLKAILDRGEATPEIARRLLFSSNRSDVQLLYRSLTPEGQQRARAAILEDALAKSQSAGDLNPTRFANELAKRGTSIGVMFSGRDLENIQGLARVLNLTRRAQEASVVTSTGQQAVPILGATALVDIFGTGGAALASGAIAGIAARMYESAAGRNILTRISRAPAGSDMETRLVNQFINNFRDRAITMSNEVSQ